MGGRRIGVIGSLNVDYVSYVRKSPERGETVLADDFSIVPGGKGANQAFALGRIGCDVSMFGLVGDDDNGKLGLANLESAGVDVSGVEVCSAPTGLALITVAEDGDNSIVVVQGANKKVGREYIDRKFSEICRCDIIVFQMEIPKETVLYAAKRLKDEGKVIILDPAPVPDGFPDELLGYADYIKPNETELVRLSGLPASGFSIEEACRLLIRRGAACILASAGPEGAFCMDRSGNLRHFPSYEVDVIDTTAAGDSFTASFAYGIANGFSFDDSVRLAVEVSTIVVQRKGAQSSIPERREILSLIERLGIPAGRKAGIAFGGNP